jgi:hypothetical protein
LEQHHPILTKLALAEEHLQYVLEHPENGLDLERIRMAISLIKFERSKQYDEAKQKARSERNS